MGGVNETKELLWPSNFVSVIANDRKTNPGPEAIVINKF